MRQAYKFKVLKTAKTQNKVNLLQAINAHYHLNTMDTVYINKEVKSGCSAYYPVSIVGDNIKLRILN